MYDFDFLISRLFTIWIVIFITMVLKIVFKSVITGVRKGCKIATIKQNVNKRIEEYDRDLKKYFDYEVEPNDLSNMHEQNEGE